MITVVPPQLRKYYGPELADMHRLRHRVFVERLRWNVRSFGGLEVDAFDMLDATYLLAGEDPVIGSWRILPTTGSYMLKDVFGELLEGQTPPCDEAVWEMSRFAVDHGPLDEKGLNALSATTGELFCGLVEYALSQGVREVWTVYDIRIARLLDRVGCRPFWRSARRRIGETIAVAGRFEISARVLAELRATNQVHGSVLNPVVEPREERVAA
jgi:acyl homoserine lactone synthase